MWALNIQETAWWYGGALICTANQWVVCSASFVAVVSTSAYFRRRGLIFQLQTLSLLYILVLSQREKTAVKKNTQEWHKETGSHSVRWWKKEARGGIKSRQTWDRQQWWKALEKNFGPLHLYFILKWSIGWVSGVEICVPLEGRRLESSRDFHPKEIDTLNATELDNNYTTY